MAKWLKATLFGRQLSHGSDKDTPETFEDALQSPFSFEPQNVEQVQQQQYGYEPGEVSLIASS